MIVAPASLAMQCGIASYIQWLQDAPLYILILSWSLVLHCTHKDGDTVYLGHEQCQACEASCQACDLFPSTGMSAPAGQKRKRAQDQAAALVGSKKPNTTPEPEAARDPSASPLQGESMDQSEQSVAPSSRRAESELHVGSLEGASQVGPGAMLPFAPSFYVSHMLVCLPAWCYHVTHGQVGMCPSRAIVLCHNAGR